MSYARPAADSTRKTRVWLWIAGAFALAVLTLFVVVGTWHTRQEGRVETLMSEISRSGEPLTPAELEEFYTHPPAAEDATQLWLDGTAPLVAPAYELAAKDLPLVGREAKIPPPGSPWSDVDAA